jgi:tetratricopeptide (TPR) repeat protein
MQSERPTLAIGLEHHQAGRLADAERIYQQVLEVDPNNLDALHLLGVIAHQVGKNEISVQLIEKALRHNPSNPYFLSNRGNALQALKRYDEALASYDKALTITPDYADALSNRGNALQGLKRFEEALVSYDKALAINPDFAEALSNRGNVLQVFKRYQEALACYDRALAIKPDHVDVLINRGTTLKVLNRYEEALASYDRALSINPDSAEALGNRGLALQELKRFEEALASYRRALAIEPDYAPAHWNESLCRLLTGDLERGWEKYEWRWKCDPVLRATRDFSQPLWLGREDITGKTILLHAEQGLGDTIQFSRYARAVAEKRAKVILEVQPALRSLLSEIPGAYKVLSRGEPLPEFDFHCPLLSLPLAFNTRLETIPAAIPYLVAKAAVVKSWEKRLGKRNVPRVGIVWSGLSANVNDRKRSIALSRLAALAGAGVKLVSLQNEVRSEDEKALAANRQILHFGSQLEDFSDTAALVSLMDLVVSVDTSVAHLAGALGKPVWILLPFAPDWRWLVDREDSPWYPTARLFRQPRIGDWDSVIDKVKQELSECF